MNRRQLLTGLAASPALALPKADDEPRWLPYDPDLYPACDDPGWVLLAQPGLAVKCVLDECSPGVVDEYLASAFPRDDYVPTEDTALGRAWDAYYREVRGARKAQSGPEPVEVYIPRASGSGHLHMEVGKPVMLTIDADIVRFRPESFDPDALPAPDPMDCECVGWARQFSLRGYHGSVHAESNDAFDWGHHENCKWSTHP